MQFAAASQEARDIDGCKGLAAIAVTLAKHGQFDRAREVANLVTQPRRREDALIRIDELSLGMK